MWRVAYIDKKDNYSQKGGFKSDKEAIEWAKSTPRIVPLTLLVWSEDIQCFKVVSEF